MNPLSDAPGLAWWAPLLGALNRLSHALLAAGCLFIAAHLLRTFLRWKNDPTIPGAFRYASALLFFCVLLLAGDAVFGRPLAHPLTGVSVFAAVLAGAASYDLHRIAGALIALRGARAVGGLGGELRSSASASARATELARAFEAARPAADPRAAEFHAQNGTWLLDQSDALRELSDILADLEAKQCKI